MLVGGMIFLSLMLTNRNEKFIKYIYGFSNFLGVMGLLIMKTLILDIINGLAIS
jgi:hypothetical protein